MSEDPTQHGVPGDGQPPADVPLTGPASRIWRYLPDGDPQDRAQKYIGESDPRERAQRYLSESQIRKHPSGVRSRSQAGGSPSQPGSEPVGDDPAPAGSATAAPAIESTPPGVSNTPAPRPSDPRLAGGAQAALQSVVASVLEERRGAVATPPPPLVGIPIEEPREPQTAPDVVPDAFVAPEPTSRKPAFRDPVPLDPEPEPQPEPEPEVVAEPDPQPQSESQVSAGAPAAPGNHLQSLRGLAERLQSTAVSPEGLQPAVDLIGAAVGADAVVLSLTVPRREQVTSGDTLGGGPRHAEPIRVDGAIVGELMACRLSDGEPFTSEDELFLGLAADQFAALIAQAAAGSALEPGDQYFVNTLVGEMRAPLGTVSGLLDDFVAGNAGELTVAQLDYLKVASDHAGRMLAIIRDLQTLSRLRRPEPHEMDVMGVGPLLDRAAMRARALAGDSGVEIIVENPGEALLVKGVPEQLDRAVGALVDNAIKFSKETGSVTLSAVLKDGTVRVTVTDNGIGMDPQETTSVFERFNRGRLALEAEIPGVGLGLSIVKEVVEVHNGRVWCESAAGQGTRVHFTLPAVT